MKKRKNFSKKAVAVFIFLVAILGIIFATSKIYKLDQKNFSNNKRNIQTQEENTEINLGCTGDILIHGPILASCYNSQSDNYYFDDIFAYLKPYISDLDYSIANLECSVSTKQWGYSGYPQFKIPESIVNSIKNAGFKMLLTANNHSNDGGSRGIFHTLET